MSLRAAVIGWSAALDVSLLSPQSLTCRHSTPASVWYEHTHTHTHTHVVCTDALVDVFLCVFVQLDTLGLVSLRQLVEVSSSPGFLSSAAAVDNLLLYVPDAQFTVFFLSLSTTLQVTHTNAHTHTLLTHPIHQHTLSQSQLRWSALIFDWLHVVYLGSDWPINRSS